MLDPEKVKLAFVNVCGGYDHQHLMVIGGLADRLKRISIVGFFSTPTRDEIYNYIYADKRTQGKLIDLSYEIIYNLMSYGITKEELDMVYDNYYNYFTTTGLDPEIKRMVIDGGEGYDGLMLSMFIIRMNLESFDNALIIANNKLQ